MLMYGIMYGIPFDHNNHNNFLSDRKGTRIRAQAVLRMWEA